MMRLRLERVRTGDKEKIVLKVPSRNSQRIWDEIAKSPDSIIVELGIKPRTTGKMSQNAKLYALLTILSQYTGETISYLKERAKLDSIAVGYPYRFENVRINGELKEVLIPFHEDELNTVQMAILIDWVEMECVKMGLGTVKE